MNQLPFSLLFVSICGVALSHSQTNNATSLPSQCGSKERAIAMLDVVKGFINETMSLYPECKGDDLNCGNKERTLSVLKVATNLIDQVKDSYPTCPDPETLHPNPIDCSEVLQNGNRKSGVYRIWPKNRISDTKPVNVFCDMDTDGGGWTVIQRRGNFSAPKESFFRDWENYKLGFGDLRKEFWIGNDNIFALSNQANNTIRFDLKDSVGFAGYAKYKTFWIENESAGYTLHIGGYSGEVGDSMDYHNKMKFSTRDRNNGRFLGESCAQNRQGAWWYNYCGHVNLNGLYQPGTDSDTGIVWSKWRGEVSLSGVEIKLRPLKV